MESGGKSGKGYLRLALISCIKNAMAIKISWLSKL
jgi:hypothetical protein